MVQIPTGLLGSEEALRNALAGAGGILEPFSQGGTGAFNLQAALSGAQGPQAQGQAFANFQASPGQQFLRDESEQALLRNASAIGGLGGGRVREALQQNAIGLASQDFGNQFNRLGQVAGLGGQAAGQQAGFVQQTGRDLSGGRLQTGSALADLAQQQGQGLSGIIGQGAGNLSNILTGGGQQQLQSQLQMAQLLQALATGQGTNLAGLTDVADIQQVSPSEAGLSNIGNILTGISEIFG